MTGTQETEDEVPHRSVSLADETLRDGLQSPSVRNPSISEKLNILRLMESLGIQVADIGLPGAGPHVAAAYTAAGAGDHRTAHANSSLLRCPHRSRGHPRPSWRFPNGWVTRSRSPLSSAPAPSASMPKIGTWMRF